MPLSPEESSDLKRTLAACTTVSQTAETILTSLKKDDTDPTAVDTITRIANHNSDTSAHGNMDGRVAALEDADIAINTRITELAQAAGQASMSGATSQTAGVAGLVPAPEAGDQDKFLKGDGTWGSEKEYTNATQSKAGLMSPADKIKVDNLAADGGFPIGAFADMRDEEMGDNWLRADGGTAKIADYPLLAATQHNYIRWGTQTEVIADCPFNNAQNYYLDIDNNVFGFVAQHGTGTGCNIVYTLNMESFFVASKESDADTGLYFNNSYHKLVYLSSTGLAILVQINATAAQDCIARYFILQLSGNSVTIKKTSEIFGRIFSSNKPSSVAASSGSPVSECDGYLYWLGVHSISHATTTVTANNYCITVYKYNVSSNTLTETNLLNTAYGGTATTAPTLYSKIIKVSTNQFIFIAMPGTAQAKVFYSSDGGVSWSVRYTFTSAYHSNYVNTPNSYNNYISTYTYYAQASFHKDKSKFAPINGRIILGSTYLSNVDAAGVLVSTNYGQSWTLYKPSIQILKSGYYFRGSVYLNGWYYLGYQYYSTGYYYAIVKTKDFVNYTVVVPVDTYKGPSDYLYSAFSTYKGYLVFYTFFGAFKSPAFFDTNGNCLTEISTYAGGSGPFGSQIYDETHNLTIGYGNRIIGDVLGGWNVNPSTITSNSVDFFPKNKDYAIRIYYGTTTANSYHIDKVPLRDYDKNTEFILPKAQRPSKYDISWTIDYEAYNYNRLADGYLAVRAK